MPLFLFTLWTGLSTLYWWNKAITLNHYNYFVIFQFINLLSFIILYKLMIQYLTRKNLETIFNLYSIAISVIVAYCIIQFLDLDQFLRPVDPTIFKRDRIVGMSGNTSHLAGYLSMCLPVLYYHRTKLSAISIVLVWAIILYTGSLSGFIGALIGTIFFNFFHKIRFKYEGILYALLGVVLLTIVLHKGWDWVIHYFLNLSGRVECWKALYPTFKKHSIVGGGLGLVRLLDILKTPTETWRHAHQEFYHFAIETGLVGLGIIIYGIIHYFKVFLNSARDRLQVAMATIFLVGLVNAMFNFPFHLFLPGSLIMLAYGGTFVLKGDNI